MTKVYCCVDGMRNLQVRFLSKELIKIERLKFQALALRSDEKLMLKYQLFNLCQGSLHLSNSFWDKT